MRGKMVFGVGLAVGFVLGSRAGRERYEQIAEAAQNLWNSRPVQTAASAAKDVAGSGVDSLKGQIVAGTANTVASVIGYDKSITTKPAKRSRGNAPKSTTRRKSAPRKVTPKAGGASSSGDSGSQR